MTAKIPFIDLDAQYRRIGARIDARVLSVLRGGAYINGPEVAELERALASFTGAAHCVACANGTDALVLLLMAAGIGKGDAVFVPAFTFVATAEAVALVGATPVFCDCNEVTFNLDVASLAEAIPAARTGGLKPRAVIAVDLFGQPAPYDDIAKVAAAHDLLVIADAAQSFGASMGGRRVGTLAWATATSFFPAKPLGCYGDGGAMFTDDADLATRLRSLRAHGQGSEKYDNVRIGLNSRLDTVQAAILIEKLAVFAEELDLRQRVADRYNAGLAGFKTPKLSPGMTSAWAQYTLRCADRKSLMSKAASSGVPTAIYYPIPLSKQAGYSHFPCAPQGVPVAEKLAAEVVSLPMHPYLDAATQDRIMTAIRA